MTNLEKIEARIKIETDKMYELLRSPNIEVELHQIISTVGHLLRLKDDELIKLGVEKGWIDDECLDLVSERDDDVNTLSA